MDVTVKINSICAGGNHINITLTTSKGSKNLMLTKADFALDPDNLEQDVSIILRNFVKESGLTNWASIKTAIEAKTFKV